MSGDPMEPFSWWIASTSARIPPPPPALQSSTTRPPPETRSPSDQAKLACTNSIMGPLLWLLVERSSCCRYHCWLYLSLRHSCFISRASAKVGSTTSSLDPGDVLVNSARFHRLPLICRTSPPLPKTKQPTSCQIGPPPLLYVLSRFGTHWAQSWVGRHGLTIKLVAATYLDLCNCADASGSWICIVLTGWWALWSLNFRPGGSILIKGGESP